MQIIFLPKLLESTQDHDCQWGKNRHAWVGSLMGFSRPKTVEICFKLANFDVFWLLSPSNALYLAVLDRKSSASFRKTPTNINVKKLPLKKQNNIQREKSLENSWINNFLVVFSVYPFGNVYDVFKINRPDTKILKIL